MLAGHDAYASAGATIAADAGVAFAGAQIVAKVQPPSPDEIGCIDSGATLISLMRPGHSADIVAAAAWLRCMREALVARGLDAVRRTGGACAVIWRRKRSPFAATRPRSARPSSLCNKSSTLREAAAMQGARLLEKR